MNVVLNPNISSASSTVRGCPTLLQHARPLSKPFRSARCEVKAERMEDDFALVERRGLLLTSAAALTLTALPWESRAEGESKVLYGMASPPTSYGGYGGNAKEAAKYTYEYPTAWKIETVGKQEKGMVGIDSRVRNPKVKLETAFTVTFGRAGEDNKRFKLGSVEQTLAGFAGADYQLQDALVSASYQKSDKRIKDGQEFYDYEVFSPDINFLASVGLKNGKVFALFVKAPAKVFKTDEAALRNIIETFTIL